MSYTCHSGGALGADMEWETQGEPYGVKTIAYSFYNHKNYSKNPKVLTVEELEEGYSKCRLANKSLKRNFDGIQYPYVKNLLARNWFQVKNSDAVFAIVKGLIDKHTALGGTGWAVQMAIDCDKPVFIYHQGESPMDGSRGWKRYMPIVGFERIDEIPKLTENFAGIGTRDINEFGKTAIKEVYGTIHL